MSTRQDYMNGKCTHREYYAQFVTEQTRQSVLRNIGLERLQQSTDPHLNDIRLSRWDGLEIVTREMDAAMREAGDWPSLAGKVCIAKEAARQILDANTVAV